MTRFFRRPALAATALAAMLALGACATGTPPSESYAQTTLLSADARQSLDARVRAFDRDINRGNLSATVDYLPPKIIAQLTEETGTSPEFIKAAAGAMLKGMTSQMQIAGGHDLSKALVGAAGNGQPYAVVPGVVRITVDGEAMTDQGYTLAMTDSGTWYLVALNDQETVDNLRRAYPEFRSVALPTR